MRQRECGRGRERIPSGLHAVSTELAVGLDLMNRRSRLGASVALRELIWARGMNRHVIEVLLLILPHKVVDT